MSDTQQDKQQDNRSPGQAGGKRYQFRQKMVAIGDDYWIENEQGEQVHKIDGKAMRIRKTFLFEDAHGSQLAKIQKRVLTLKETMEVTGPNGEQLAVVKKDLITPLREHFVVEVKNGSDLDIHGNILDHEYQIADSNGTVAEVSKKFFHIRDSYSVLVQPGQDDVIILAIVLCIDAMTHAGN